MSTEPWGRKAERSCIHGVPESISCHECASEFSADLSAKDAEIERLKKDLKNANDRLDEWAAADRGRR